MLATLLALAGLVSAPPVQSYLPPGATITTRAELDLTGDGRPEIIIGYSLPRPGLPPSLGKAILLEPTRRGRYRRVELAGDWAGHYVPRFTALDLTGDGRPELVEEVAGGGAWEFLRVFDPRRGYKQLLESTGVTHLIWDPTGDGDPQVIARRRWGSIGQQFLQRIIWRDGRFVAWHAPEWSYAFPASGKGPEPNVVGLTLAEAQQALNQAGLSLGVIAELDVPGDPERIIRSERKGDEVEVVIPAGDTRFTGPKLPALESVQFSDTRFWGAAPVAQAASDLARWQGWVQGLVDGTQQVVHARFPEAPAYLLKLATPWQVELGGKPVTVSWVGVPLQVPYEGLLYLGTELERPGFPWPRFTAALYTRAPLGPLPIPKPEPLKAYLKTHKALDAFVTTQPPEWAEAVRQRGIEPKGWPELEYAPALEGPVTPDPQESPVQDHLVVTVLNGFARRAVRQGDTIRVELNEAPGRAYRWVLPLTGFNQATQVVQVRLESSGRLVAERAVALDSWRAWAGNPGPGSLTE